MLKKIGRFLIFLFFAFSFFIGCWIYIDNKIPVDITLFGIVFSELSLGFVLLVTFSIGVFVGLFGNILVTSLMALKLRRMQKLLARAESDKKSA